MDAPLFHRFKTPKSYTMNDFKRELTDILGARRSYPFNIPGILGWGLPNVYGLTPSSDEDQQKIAGFVQSAVADFEPRLNNVHVSVMDNESGFAFHLEAVVHSAQDGDNDISLEIFVPPKTGGLGAEIRLSRS